MPLLIDGYNLLHASGVLPSRAGPATFERARGALLAFLAQSLTDKERSSAVIVFDAANSPHGVPDRYHFEGISVRFARGYATADDLLAELIDDHSSARQLTVVSSDHQVQRAARRRRAKPIDSDEWMRELVQRKRSGESTVDDAKPQAPLSPAEVQQWLREFGES
jgi:predicted RNA-binding protein with PIN domain